MDDDLCFIRYLIVAKFISNEEHIPYLVYNDEKEKYKNYYTYRRRPQVNPDMINRIDILLPFINYPCDDIMEKAKALKKKYFGEMTPREIVEKKGFTKEYINEC